MIRKRLSRMKDSLLKKYIYVSDTTLSMYLIIGVAWHYTQINHLVVSVVTYELISFVSRDNPYRVAFYIGSLVVV